MFRSVLFLRQAKAFFAYLYGAAAQYAVGQINSNYENAFKLAGDFEGRLENEIKVPVLRLFRTSGLHRNSEIVFVMRGSSAVNLIEQLEKSRIF